MTNYDPSEQRLYFDDLINCREMGGMPGSDSRVFKKGIMIRAGSPANASQKAYRELKEFGIKTVIDLRSTAELMHRGNPFKDDPDIEFYNIPLFVGDPDSNEDPTMNFLRTHTMGDFYVMLIQKLGSQVVEVMRAFIRCSGNYILFHCEHGKDRTGVIAAILYMLIGASEENIVLNYKVSYEYAKHFLDPLMEDKEECMKHTLRSDAGNMVTLLNFFDERYNMRAEDYLKENGMTEEEINTLKSIIC